MSASLDGIGAVTLFVDDLAGSKAFYANAFDVPLVWEDESSAVFRFENTVINLLARPAIGDLIAPAAVAGPGAGSGFMLSIWVEDANARYEGLTARGVAVLNGPVDRPWGKRTVAFADPDGHVWELAQDIPPAAA